MLRIDEIWVKKAPESKQTYIKLQEIVEKKLQEAASSTRFRSIQADERLEIILGNPISFQTVNRIFKAFSDEGIKIKEIVWKTEKIPPFELGYLEITVS